MVNPPENHRDTAMRRYWKDVREMEEALDSNSVASIAGVRHRLLQSGDEIRKRLGNCLSEVESRPDWQQAKVDAYRAARAVFDQWKNEQGKQY